MTRYYPGFLAALFLILLRIAIGWHFLHEGSEKYRSIGRGKEAFSAEIYLRNANGPLAPYFRGLLPDVDGREALDLSRLKESWRGDVNRITDYFRFDDAQRAEASRRLDVAERWADHWFSDPENQDKRKEYLHKLDQLEQIDHNPRAMSFERERATEARRALDTDRRGLIGPLEERGKALRDEVAKLATSEQIRGARAPLLSRVGPSSASASDHDAIKAAEAARPWDRLHWINFATTYGLIAIGICLILGFLTPLAALGAAAFLAMIYLSMPPWPGLPDNPKAEGHYYLVSKNLIEMLACLVIATTPTGHWIGLDALFFGARRRRRLAQAPVDRATASAPAPGRAPENDRIVTTKSEPDRTAIPLG
jgi:uncharacterized membrane protein YphA (DoxX/SURF4 family)